MSDTEREQFEAAREFVDKFMPKAKLGTRVRVRQAWIAAYRAGRESAFAEIERKSGLAQQLGSMNSVSSQEKSYNSQLLSATEPTKAGK